MKQSKHPNYFIVIGITVIILLLSIPNITFKLGMYYFENGIYDKAKQALQFAINLKPQNKDYRYYYVRTLSKLSPNYFVQKEVYKISKGKNNDSANSLAQSIVDDWRAIIQQNIGDNYIEQAPTGTRLIRWNKKSFPLKVYIDRGSLSNLPEYYYSSISRALNQWDKSIDFVSFVNVSKPNDANIIISFEPLPANVCNSNICKFAVGYTTPKIYLNTLQRMIITIYDKDPIGKYFSDKDIYNTVLHELGHALGIMGHSYNSNDLMYQSSKNNSDMFAKFRSDFNYLSGVDVNTLKLLYMLEPDVTNISRSDKSGLIYTPIVLGSKQDILNRKLNEALHYVKKSPQLAVGYIDLAIVYSEMNEHKKAIKALHNAENLAKDNSEKFIVYNNLGVIYRELNDNNNAAKYFNLAEQYK